MFNFTSPAARIAELNAASYELGLAEAQEARVRREVIESRKAIVGPDVDAYVFGSLYR